MNKLLVIEEALLPDLKKLYDVHKPLHIATSVAIEHFIKRFEKKPEWTKLVKFFSLNDNWKQTGTFVMVNGHDDHILFNTLEPSPYKSLNTILDLVPNDRSMLLRFRSVFSPVVLDMIRRHNLEITSSSSYKNFYFYLEKQLKVEPPKGFYFDSLSQRHVEQINAAWAYRDSRSSDYISNIIAQNPSTGLFDKATGGLVAWTMQDETGAPGNLGVIEKYRRNGYGEMVCMVQYAKMGTDVTGLVADGNHASIELMTKNGVQWVDNTTCLSIRPKASPKVLGRL